MLNKSFNKSQVRNTAGGISQSIITGKGFLTTIFGAFEFLAASLAIPARLFLRKDIGERSISGLSISVFFALHIFIIIQLTRWVMLFFVAYHIQDFKGVSDWLVIVSFVLINPITFYLIIVAIKLIHHFSNLRKRLDDEGIVEYSYKRGVSIFEDININYRNKAYGFSKLKSFFGEESVNNIIIEPSLIIKAGLKIAAFWSLVWGYNIILDLNNFGHNAPVYIYFIVTGLSIAISGICLAIEEINIALNDRGIILDKKDSKLLYDKENMKDVDDMFEDVFE